MRRFANIDAGIVDQDVDAAEFAHGARDHVSDGRLVGDIARDGYRLDAALLQFSDRRDRLRFIASDDGDSGAGFRQPARHAKADAAIAAGDDGDFASEVE